MKKILQSMANNKGLIALYFLTAAHLTLFAVSRSNNISLRHWMDLYRSSIFAGKVFFGDSLGLNNHEVLSIFRKAASKPGHSDKAEERAKKRGQEAQSEAQPLRDIRELSFYLSNYKGERLMLELLQEEEPHAALMLSGNDLFPTGFLVRDGEKMAESAPFGMKLSGGGALQFIHVEREGDELIAFIGGKEAGRMELPHGGPIRSLLLRSGTETSRIDDLAISGFGDDGRPFLIEESFSVLPYLGRILPRALAMGFGIPLAGMLFWIWLIRRRIGEQAEADSEAPGGVAGALNRMAAVPAVMAAAALILRPFVWLTGVGAIASKNYDFFKGVNFVVQVAAVSLLIWAVWILWTRTMDLLLKKYRWARLEIDRRQKIRPGILLAAIVVALGAAWFAEGRLENAPVATRDDAPLFRLEQAGAVEVNEEPFVVGSPEIEQGSFNRFNWKAYTGMEFEAKIPEEAMLRVDVGRLDVKEVMGRGGGFFHSVSLFRNAPPQIQTVGGFAAELSPLEVDAAPDWGEEWSRVQIIYLADTIRVYVNGKLAQRSLVHRPYSGGAMLSSYGEPVSVRNLSYGLLEKPRDAIFWGYFNAAARIAVSVGVLSLALQFFALFAFRRDRRLAEAFYWRLRVVAMPVFVLAFLYNLVFAYVADYSTILIFTTVLLALFLAAAWGALNILRANRAHYGRRSALAAAALFFLVLLETSRFVFPGMDVVRIREWQRAPVPVKFKMHFDSQVRNVNWSMYGKKFLTQSFRRSKGDKARMVIQGGSTTWGVGVDKPELVFSEVLERRLNEERLYGKEWEVINGAFQGSNTFTGYQMFRGVLLDYDPDVLLLNYGYNDRFDRGNVGQYEKPESLLSKLFRGSGSVIFAERFVRAAGLFPPHFRHKSVEFYEKHTRAYADLCRKNGVRFLFSLQPHEIPWQMLEKEKSYTPQKGLLAVQKVLPRLEEEGILELVDLPTPFWERRLDSLFVDDWHLTARGNELAADVIFDYMKEHPMKLNGSPGAN